MLLPLIALVAACSRGPDRIQHGRWDFEVVMTELDATGLSAEQQQQARAGLNQPQTNRECVTPDEAANPLSEIREQFTRNQGASCQTTDDVFSGGIIRFRASCRGSNGSSARVQLALEGRFEAITLIANVSVTAEGPNPNGSGTVTLRTRGTVRGRRVGDCARN
jgi:hypothetical protein